MWREGIRTGVKDVRHTDMRLQNRVVFFSTRQLVLDTFTFAHSETLSVKLRALWFQRADDGSRAAKRRNLVGEAERSRHRGRRCPQAARTKPGPPERCTKPGRAALRRGRQRPVHYRCPVDRMPGCSDGEMSDERKLRLHRNIIHPTNRTTGHPTNCRGQDARAPRGRAALRRGR